MPPTQLKKDMMDDTKKAETRLLIILKEFVGAVWEEGRDEGRVVDTDEMEIRRERDLADSCWECRMKACDEIQEMIDAIDERSCPECLSTLKEKINRMKKE